MRVKLDDFAFEPIRARKDDAVTEDAYEKD